jgi:predicted metal-dependent hydrolase
MEMITKTQIEKISKETFKKLTNNNITIDERKNILINFITNENKMCSKMYNMMVIRLENEVNEKPSILFKKTNSMAEANFKLNRIWINTNLIYNYLNSCDEFKTLYLKELKYIKRNVVTKEDAVKWIVAHEVAHTIRLDKVNHTLSFFQTVEDLFKSLK